MAPGPVTTGMTCFFACFAGCAATGIAKFLRGLAGIPVAGGTRKVFVLLAAGAGVKGSGFGFFIGFYGIAGCWLCNFRHLFTNRMVIIR
jgi:hypothetical protein